jgi:uroporphyrinogen-III synthase
VLVALTRERGRNEDLRRLVARLAEVVETPLTMTTFRDPHVVGEEIRESPHFGSYCSLVVTSARTQSYVGSALEAMMNPYEVLSVGSATTEMLARERVSVTHESSGPALGLASFITRGPVLLLGAVGGRDELLADLTTRQLHPVLVECYETVPVELDDEARQRVRRADVVFIGAPSAWRVARTLVPQNAWVLVPGATTLEFVRADHERVLLGWGEQFDAAWEHVGASVI